MSDPASERPAKRQKLASDSVDTNDVVPSASSGISSMSHEEETKEEDTQHQNENTAFRLLDLPLELREKIYEFAFEGSTIVYTKDRVNPNTIEPSRVTTGISPHTSLMLVSPRGGTQSLL